MTDQSVLVVGATGGLGPDVVRALVSAGYQVHFSGRRSEVVDELVTENPGSIGHTVDATEEGAIRGVIEEIDNESPLTAYVHLAGGYSGGQRIDKLTDEDWNKMREANWTTLRNGASAAFGVMRKHEAASIVTIGAVPAIRGSVGSAPYAVAKAAVIAFTLCLAEEGKSCGVRANCIVPGILDTAANRKAMPDGDTKSWVSTEQVGDTIVYLCGPASAGINGSTILMNGRM